MRLETRGGTSFEDLLERFKRNGDSVNIDNLKITLRAAIAKDELTKQKIVLYNLDKVDKKTLSSFIFDVQGLSQNFLTQLEIEKSFTYITPTPQKTKIKKLKLALAQL